MPGSILHYTIGPVKGKAGDTAVAELPTQCRCQLKYLAWQGPVEMLETSFGNRFKFTVDSTTKVRETVILDPKQSIYCFIKFTADGEFQADCLFERL